MCGRSAGTALSFTASAHILRCRLQVTFCKRKGGLFKKADDLSKLCGCEVAVLIVSTDGVTKALDFASSNTDVNRVSLPCLLAVRSQSLFRTVLAPLVRIF